MKAKRRRREPECKARVALKALKGVQTIEGIGQQVQGIILHISNSLQLLCFPHASAARVLVLKR